MLFKLLKNYFSVQPQDIQLGSLEIPPILPSNQDYIRLCLDPTLFQIIQIDVNKTPQIAVTEQLRWEINAKLPKPIEEYAIATTIFFQDEQTLKALGAALENTLCKKLIEKIQSQGKLVKEITSADKQFIFFKQNLRFYVLPQFLKKINLGLGLLSIFFLLLSGLFFIWHQHNDPKQINDLNTTTVKLKNLETKYTQHLNYKAQQQTLHKNKQRLTGILKTLNQLKNTPTEIILDEITFAADQTITIRGISKTDKAVDQFGKILKKISNKTTLLETTHSNTQTNFEFFIPPSKIQARNKNNANY